MAYDAQRRLVLLFNASYFWRVLLRYAADFQFYIYDGHAPAILARKPALPALLNAQVYEILR